MAVATLIEKTDLVRKLKALAAFDKGSPYVCVQLFPNGDKAQFHRCSAMGFIQTKNYCPTTPVAYVSLTHFIDCLKNLPEDAVELGIGSNGILRLYGTSSDVFESESHVHTVGAGQAGMTRHEIGDITVTLEPSIFSTIDVRPFNTLIPPVVSRGKLMLSTNAGATVMWSGPTALAQVPELYPRDPFLRAVAGGTPITSLGITSKGYWAAEIGELVTYIKGHVQNRQIFDNYSVKTEELARLPADRLVLGLASAVGLLEPTELVNIDPRLGVLAKGKFGDSRNSLGDTGTWSKFTLQARTAKVVHDALKQAPEDYVVLSSVANPSVGMTLRLQRGPFEVNFRAHG